MRHLGVCHCECVFVDVGLNDGSTLLHWPRNAARSTAMSAGTIRRDRRIPGLRWHLREQPLLRARMKRCSAWVWVGVTVYVTVCGVRACVCVGVRVCG